jgi:hypothetical protein
MIKRVNFTGRRRVPRNRVDIEVYDGHPRTFDAKIDLSDMSFPPHAAVVLEAMCAGSNDIERFEFGEVGGVVPQTDRSLVQLEGENVFFRLKVIDRTERFGRLLGLAEHIRPQRAGKQTAAGRRGILPVEPAELGQQLWKLDFKEHDVFLLVNKSIHGLGERVRSDPLFYAVVYPQVVRQVLMQAIAEDVDLDEDDDRWPVMWLRFGKNLHPTRESPPSGESSQEEREEWIEEVVDAFCDEHSMKDKYSSVLAGNGGDT